MPRKKEIEESELNDIAKGLECFLGKMHDRWYLPTGNLALDYAISMKVDGTGGYPGGCVTELFGDPSTGKSLLLAKALAEAQKMGAVAVVADAENRWDDDFAAQHGVIEEERKIFQPDTVEAFAVYAHKIFENAKTAKQKVVMVLDSLAILSTIKETGDLEEGDLKADQGRKAQKIRQAMRILKSSIRDTQSILLIANHVIANPGAYGNPRTTPGGGGVPFQSSVRIELLNPTQLKLEGKNHPIGVELHAKVTKNSIAPPFGMANVRMYNGPRGVDKYSGLVDIMKDLDVVSLSGSWYAWNDVKFQAKDLAKIINDHPEILEDPKWKSPYFME